MLGGEKVVLRPYRQGFSNEEISRQYHWELDPEVLSWSGWAPTNLTLREFREQLKKRRANPQPDREMFAILTHQGELIGRLGYYHIDRQKREAELGIVIGQKEYWGQGYGRDAVRTLLRHVFTTTDLERIYLTTFSDNLRAQRCFAACGFKRLKAVKQLSLELGSYDGLEMEIRRQDFLNGGLK